MSLPCKKKSQILSFYEIFRLISYEGEQVKLKLAYREIGGAGPASKPNQFNLKTPQMTEIYITESVQRKETALAIVNDFRKKVSRKGEENNIDLLQVKPHTEQVSIHQSFVK